MATTRDSHGDVADLPSSHEEADTRMLFHARYTASSETRIIIRLPDTYVLVLSATHFTSIKHHRKSCGSSPVLKIKCILYQFMIFSRSLETGFLLLYLPFMLSPDVTAIVQSQGLVRQKHGKQGFEAKCTREVLVFWDKKSKKTK